MLTAGRSVPGTDCVRQRGEGVANVLSGPAVSAWRAGGSKWKPWSSRIVSVSIKVGLSRQDCLSVLSLAVLPHMLPVEKNRINSTMTYSVHSLKCQQVRYALYLAILMLE